MAERAVTDPYVGPRPFERADESRFFGREPESRELVSRVIAHQVVVFYAQSGAGKTSLLNAGLLPRLEDRGAEVLSARVGGERPKDVDPAGVPNPYSFGVLLSLLEEGTDPRDMVDESLPSFFKLREHATDDGRHPLLRVLILDRFEELLTLYPERRTEREGFFVQLRQAIREDPLLRVVLAIRDEYMAEVEGYLRLIPEELRTRFRIERLRGNAALEAVTGPLAHTGRRFADGVAETLVRDLLTTGVPAEGTEQIPEEFVEPVQLQVVCHNLWSSLKPEIEVITQDHLSKFGNVDQVLADFYESIIHKAATESAADEYALRDFCENALITSLGTRGTVVRGTERSGGVPNDAIEVLENEHLIRAQWRAGAYWYELTHDRLMAPIQKSNEDARARRDQEARTKRRRRLVVIMVVVGALLASFMLAYARWANNQLAQEREATERQARFTQSLQFAAWVPDALARDPELGLLLAMEAISVTYSVDNSRTVEAYAALWQALDSPPSVILQGHTASVNSARFDSQGQQIVTASADKTARLWDLGGEPLAILVGHKAAVLTARFSSDGRYVLTASEDSTARLWDESGVLVAEFLGHDGAVNGAVFGPSAQGDPPSELILTASADATARVWDTRGNLIATLRGHTGPVNSAVFNRSGDLIVTASADGTARLWSPDGNPLATLTGHTASVNYAEFSPDGELVLTASEDGTARLWTLAGRDVATMSGHSQPISHAAFSPHGERVVTAGSDGTARLWDLQGRAEVILAEHSGPVNYAAFSPDGLLIATASTDGSVRLWYRDGRALGALSGRNAEALDAEFSPDSQMVLTAKAGGAARLHYISVDRMMALAQSRVTRSLTAEELELYGGAYKVLAPTPTPSPTRAVPSVTPPPTPSAPAGMVLVPASEFLMGSSQEDVDLLLDLCRQFVSGCNRDSLEDQLPQRTISLDSFYIDAFEVTNAQYAKCVEAGSCREPEDHTSLDVEDYYSNPAYNDHPVVRIDWFDAKTYCEWVEKRLPTEAEWEKAARGIDGRMYPWGNQEPDATRLNYCDARCWQYFRDQSVDDGYADTSPVGTYPMGVSPYSVYDMSGNVWEWVADWYGSDYYLSGLASNPTGPSQGSERVIRGGSFENSRHVTSATYRSHAAPDIRTYPLGFRCAASAQ
jgi:formylglycine-generating enzyme required for sulfatase activity